MATKAADSEDKQPKRVTPVKPKAASAEKKSAVASTKKTEAKPVVTEGKPVVAKDEAPVTAATGSHASPSHHEESKRSGSTKKVVTRVLSAVVGLIVIVIVVFGVLIYGYRSESTAIRDVSGIVPYPAMMVGHSFVSYHEYLFELDSIKQYYQSQASANGQTALDFNSSQGKTELEQLRQQIMTQLKSDEVTRQLIAKNKITVSKSELNSQFNQLEQSAGGETKLKQVLTKVYGWNESDLKSKLKFQLATQKLQTKITSDPAADAAAKAKAQDIYSQIKSGKISFSDAAKKYSQDTTAANGGDLGFFSKGQMVKEFEDVAFAQNPGDISQPTKTQYGYHIIETIEFNADKSQVHAAHILIKTVDFTDYLNKQIAATKSTTYIKK